MSEPQSAGARKGPAPTPKASFWLRELPYLIVLGLTLVGVGLTAVSRTPPTGYWEFMALVLCVVTISSAWAETSGRNARLRLIVTQALHWLSFLVAMNLTLLPGVQRILNPEATGITALLLLALGALTAGINILSWQIAFIGLVLAISVPLKAWLQQGAVVVVLGLIVAAVGLGVIYSWRRGAVRKEDAAIAGRETQ
jgi:hypothetical protein